MSRKVLNLNRFITFEELNMRLGNGIFAAHNASNDVDATAKCYFDMITIVQYRKHKKFIEQRNIISGRINNKKTKYCDLIDKFYN